MAEVKGCDAEASTVPIGVEACVVLAGREEPLSAFL